MIPDSKETICAVVVTYNRMVMLAECLNGLLNQSRAPENILVVDNASTDGTREMLGRDFPQVEVVRLPENTGGSGGFHAGIREAYDRGFDWIWVMDDDVEPYRDCLFTMLRDGGFSDFIHVRREYKGVPFSWEGVWDTFNLEKRNLPHDISFENGRPWLSVNYACFEGALIHRRVVSKIGLPDVRFFIGGDDSIYGYLASFHTNVIYLNYIGIEKKLPGNVHPDRRKIYFTFRNRFLIYEYLKKNDFPVSRKVLWIGSALLFSYLLKSRKEIRNAQAIRSVLTGIRDGYQGRYGRPAWLNR